MNRFNAYPLNKQPSTINLQYRPGRKLTLADALEEARRPIHSPHLKRVAERCSARGQDWAPADGLTVGCIFKRKETV